MAGWTEDEFRRAALGTRISERTLEACKDVLIEGMSGIDAADKHRIFASAISRAVTTLREKHSHIVEFAAVSEKADEMLQYAATKVAKARLGDDFECTVAEPGQTYEGQVIAQSKGYIVQKVGRSGVLHDVARFSELPPFNRNLQIAYDQAGGLAKVERLPTHRKSTGPER